MQAPTAYAWNASMNLRIYAKLVLLYQKRDFWLFRIANIVYLSRLNKKKRRSLIKNFISDKFARKLIYFAIILVVIDQVTKLAVKGFSIPFLGIEYDGMYLGQTMPVLGNFFRLTFVENKGIAFGIELHPVVKVLVSLVSFFAGGFIIYYINKIATENKGAAVGLALILGGAIGNMIDRVFYGVFYGYAPLFYGHVVDFFHVVFDVKIFGYYIDSFPIFNIADIAVSLGVAVLFIFYGKEKTEPAEGSTDESAPLPAEQEFENNSTEEKPKTAARQISISEETVEVKAEVPADGEDNNRKDI